MSSNTGTQEELGLRAEALGFGKSVVMGVAGMGPAYSLAATAAVLIGSSACWCRPVNRAQAPRQPAF